MKFSLCIETIFTELVIFDRIRVAKDFGLDAFEIWDPSPYDCKEIGMLSQKLGIPISVCGMYKSWTYRLNSPYENLKTSIEKTVLYGRQLGCNTFIGLSGDLECKSDSQKIILLENLKRIADRFEKENVTLVVEPLNSLYDHKGYYLDSSYIGFEIVKAINSPSIKILFDCYHMQIMEGNLTNNINNNIHFIGHFHSAGVPGRHELHLGETNYPHVIQAAENAGYTRYFGFEYWPSYEHEKSIQDVLAYVKGKK